MSPDWSVRARTAAEWVWSTNLWGRNACSNVSTDGFGDDGSTSAPLWKRTMSSSDNTSNGQSLKSGSIRTAGKPAGSISAMSHPEPFTHRTSVSSPRRSVTVVLTDVFPPPCSTRSGSRPRRRVV